MINNNDANYFNYIPTHIKENKFSVGVNNNNKDFFNYCDTLINIPQFTQESKSYRVESLINPLDILTGEESIYYDLKELNSKLSGVSNAIPNLEKIDSVSLNKIDYFNNISNIIKEILSLSLSIISMLVANSDAKTGGGDTSNSSGSAAEGMGIAMEVLNMVGNISTMTNLILSHQDTMKHYDNMISDLNKQIELLDKDLKLAKETYDSLYKPNRMFKAKSTSTLPKR